MRYSAPEAVAGYRGSEEEACEGGVIERKASGDVWCIGATMYHVLYRSLPSQGQPKTREGIQSQLKQLPMYQVRALPVPLVVA